MRPAPMYIPHSSLTCAHCACPRLLAMAWITPQCYGGALPFLLVTAPTSGEAARTVERIVTELKLIPGTRSTGSEPAKAAVLLEPDGWGRCLVALVLGSEEMRRIPVTTSWKELARQRGRVNVVLGLPPDPVDDAPDTDTGDHGEPAIMFLARVRDLDPLTRARHQ